MPDGEELFTHEVEAWTVGDLRKAMEHAPDEMPVTAAIAEEPGGDSCGEQVVFAAALWRSKGNDMPPDMFMIECEFPSGQYYRRKDDYDA